MKKLFLLLLIVPGLSLQAQTAEKWQRIYGGDGIDYGYSVKTCLRNGYVAVGSSSTNGVTDGYMIRTDTMGMLLWTKYFSGNNVDVFRSIRILPDSGFIVAGYSNSGGHGGYDGWLVRTDKNGDTLWTKYIGTSDWDFFYDVYPTYDGGFILAGGTYGAGSGDEDMYFVRTDANGDTLWTRTYGGAKEDEARGIVETGDQLFAASGFTKSKGDTLYDGWLLRMDQSGDTLWTRTAGHSNSKDKWYGVGNCSTYSRLYVCGEDWINGNSDCFIGCYSYTGTFLYSNIFGGTQDDDYYGMVVHADATMAAIGTTFSYGGGNGDMYMHVDRYGWSFPTHGTLQEDRGFALDTTADDAYIACGFTVGYSSNLPNLYLVKTDTMGNSTMVLDVREPIAAGDYGTAHAFPNPATELLNITVDAVDELPRDMQISIYDMTGRLVLTNPGTSWTFYSNSTARISLGLSALSPGAYFFTIRSGDRILHNGRFLKSNP